MNQHVNAISNRLSLRQPQRDSLEILAKVCEIIELDKNADLTQQLEIIKSTFPTVEHFERDFPSLCFALANTKSVKVHVFRATRGCGSALRLVNLAGR